MTMRKTCRCEFGVAGVRVHAEAVNASKASAARNLIDGEVTDGRVDKIDRIGIVRSKTQARMHRLLGIGRTVREEESDG